MKLLAFAVILAIVMNAVSVYAQQGCVSPLENITSFPDECQNSVVSVSEALGNLTQPNFTDIDAQIRNFCKPECVQRFVDYYQCLGESEYASILDGLLCGEYNNQSCLQLWNDVYSLIGTDPNGINYTIIRRDCRDPLMCSPTCSTELNKAVDMLECCLAGIVEFNLCGPLEKRRFEECSIQIPPICVGVTNTSTTPAPAIPPTEGMNCVHPLNDTNYPTRCQMSLMTVDNITVTASSEESLASLSSAIPTSVEDVLDEFCTPECARPLVDYYNCTGEPGYANLINGFFCGRDDDQYCLVAFRERIGQTGQDVLNIADTRTIRNQCNDVLGCSPACRSALTKAKTVLGCCLPGATEFTVCGVLEQVRFDECGIHIGDVCPGINLIVTAEPPTSEGTEPTRETDESGGIVIVPFGFTLLGIVAFVVTKLA